MIAEAVIRLLSLVRTLERSPPGVDDERVPGDEGRFLAGEKAYGAA
jgi:hypothetical protein